MSSTDDLDVAHTFVLLQTLLVSVGEIDLFLQELAVLAARLTSPPVSCGITIEYDGHPLTVSSSDAWARQLDETQYRNGQGPCLQAMRTGLVVHVPQMTQETRWPDYIRQAGEGGLQASLSLPLIVEDRSVGAVNFYSPDANQVFVDEVRVRAELFAAQASTALLLAVRALGQTKTNEQLERALTSRSMIDQAIGILMAQQSCSADRAFGLLRQQSQNNNRLLRDVAQDVVDRVGGSVGGDA